MIKLCVFDLDGTLIDSLKDLAISTNYALVKNGFKEKQLEDFPYLVGDGIQVLMERALGEEYTHDSAKLVLADFLEYYGSHYADFTLPCEGVPELLHRLVEKGIPLAVLSNKSDLFTRKLVDEMFPEVNFSIVMGKREEFPRKPDPSSLVYLLDELGIKTDEAMLVGDSDVDVHTAHNAGIQAIEVSWGFRNNPELKAAGADYIVENPSEIISIISNFNNPKMERPPLICPICKESLSCDPKRKFFSCKNNHGFDISKQGYVNLLTNSQKNSNLPGDSKEMVHARREFLSKGYYSELSRKINELVFQQIALGKGIIELPSSSTTPSILDIGCGEGYYTNALMEYAREMNIHANYIGLDISREAVKHASSINREITWIVANSHYLPIQDASIDCILSVFSPIKISECIRVLKRNGVLIRVLPGVAHLIQLREIIYPNVVLVQDIDMSKAYEGMKLKESSRATFDISLDNPGMLSLTRMTPHYWKTSKTDKEALNEIEQLTVTIDMQIFIFEKICI